VQQALNAKPSSPPKPLDNCEKRHRQEKRDPPEELQVSMLPGFPQRDDHQEQANRRKQQEPNAENGQDHRRFACNTDATADATLPHVWNQVEILPCTAVAERPNEGG
jgi:hypothetical protein